MATDFPYKPLQRPGSRSTTAAVNVTPFGGGYQQRVKQAPNNIERTWTLSYNDDLATIRIMEQFLAGKEGYQSFTIDDPDTEPPVQVSVVVESWRVTALSGTREQLTATFTEAQWSAGA